MTPEAHKDKEVPGLSGTKTVPTAPKGAPTPAGRAGAPATAAKNSAGSKRTWRSKALVGAVAAAVLLGAGTFFGTTLPDPSKSEQYVALQDSKAGADQKVQSLQKDYTTLEQIYLELKDGIESRESKVVSREQAVAEAEKKNSETEAALKKRETTVSGAEAQKAKNTFDDGTRTVGRDIEPGTYITTADVGSSCYWAILTSGTNGSDIVDNDIPGGGRPSVTISAGQDFKSSRCGSWTKQ